MGKRRFISPFDSILPSLLSESLRHDARTATVKLKIKALICYIFSPTRRTRNSYGVQLYRYVLTFIVGSNNTHDVVNMISSCVCVFWSLNYLHQRSSAQCTLALAFDTSKRSIAFMAADRTIEDQRPKLHVAKPDRNPQRSGVCGELTVDRSTVSRWAIRFRASLDDDARPGRPKTSTHEKSVKLVADAFQEDRRAMCEELSEATGISPNPVFRILTKNFKKRTISAL
ncbi:hypothetical protein ANN_02496 [Periplaneta americana]|uniref:Uncharacterized protein n=1 Tax=Periplaneta americana TaxID=6978 RepID=A0ABQ8TWJ7_PERAM|nr:hypothetical protein ANN_02496 [Periplaneta americana]